MAALVCEFPDKIRFYDQVLREEERKVFVETSEDLRAGAEVEVSIHFASANETLTAHGKVVAKRAKAAAGQEPGVWVQFEATAADALRQQLHIDEGEGAQITTRGSPRFDSNLPVLLEKPFRQPFRTVNISQGGVCLDGVMSLPMGQTVRMSLEFADRTVAVFGRIAWRSDMKQQTGVEFRFQSDEARHSIAEEVRRIADEKQLVVFGKPTVLIVDDDIGTLRALERVLEHRGYGTLTATSGPEALSVARERSPALILLDVLLPGMNGLEVCRALKRDVGTSSIPVVLTSVLPRENLEMLLGESGALTALPKPYRFELLSDLVRGILDQNQSMQTSTGEEVENEQRTERRVPIFERCNYQSESLRLETYLREASESGGFLVSYWGEAPGTKGKLTIMHNMDSPVELQVEVVHRTHWGIAGGESPTRIPGIGLKFNGGTGREVFNEWLAAQQASIEGKPIILIVDDDRSHLEILSVILKNAGYGVVTLDSPFGVANAVALADPALVILDYMMPGLDGATLCKSLKANPNTNAPVWLYSSVSEEHLEELATEAGADGHMRKGERPSDIATRIETFLRARGTGVS